MKTWTLALPLLFASTCYAAPNKEQYELQERCGKLTKNAFEREWGRDGVVNNEDSRMLANYRNHYNAKLNKCFYLQSVAIFPKSKEQGISEEVLLYDLNENKAYGYFHRMRKYGSGAPEAPDNCHVLENYCRSDNEWESLIKPYMEE